jgi:hypothetical protein
MSVTLSNPDFRMKPHSKGFICHRNNTATKIKKGFNNSGSKIYAGMPLALDTIQGNGNFECPDVKNWTSTSTQILGFAAQPAVVDYLHTDDGEYFETSRPVAWVDSESIILTSLTTFTPAQANAIRMYSTGVNIGMLRNTAIAGQTVLLSGAKIESVEFYNGLFYCKVNLSGNISFTADV